MLINMYPGKLVWQCREENRNINVIPKNRASWDDVQAHKH